MKKQKTMKIQTWIAENFPNNNSLQDIKLIFS